MREKVSREERILVYRAATLLRLLTGWGRRKIARKIKELYEISLDLATLEKLVDRYIQRGCRPRGYIPTSFERSMYFGKVRELVLRIHQEHPEWGYRKVTKEVIRRLGRLPIRISHSTVWALIHGVSIREREISLYIDSIEKWMRVAYVLGACIGDMERKNEYLSVKDQEFAWHVAHALSELRHSEVNPVYDKRKNLFRIHVGAWMRDAIDSGLWKIIADIFPIAFLQGFFDAEGYVSPNTNYSRITTVEVGANGRDEETIRFVEKLLRKCGYETSFYETMNNGKPLFVIIIRGFDQVDKFAKEIGFRVAYRKRYLEFLLSLKEKPQRERYEEWEELGGVKGFKSPSLL